MSGSIFVRGGQKAEVHGTPGEQSFNAAHLEAKLAELQTAWAAPLLSSTQSLAIWQAPEQTAEITIERGHLLQRMGYRQSKKLFLHIEEAVYGNTLEYGAEQTLSFLHPATWVVHDAQDSRHKRKASSAPEHETSSETTAANTTLDIPNQFTQEAKGMTATEVNDPTLFPPLKRAKLATDAHQAAHEPHTRWWPTAFESRIWSLAAADENQEALARFHVMVDSTEAGSGPSLPKLKKFPSIQRAGPNEVRIPEDLKLVYDVLKPNKHFSKGKPDDPRLAVCLATSAYVPTRSVLQHLQDQVSPVPLQFARVAGGEVSFHSIQGLS